MRAFVQHLLLLHFSPLLCVPSFFSETIFYFPFFEYTTKIAATAAAAARYIRIVQVSFLFFSWYLVLSISLGAHHSHTMYCEWKRERMEWKNKRKRGTERMKQWRTRDKKRVHVSWCMWQMHMKYVLLWKFFMNRFGPPLPPPPPLVVADRVLSLRTICADVYKSYTYEYIQQRQIVCLFHSLIPFVFLCCLCWPFACLLTRSFVRPFDISQRSFSSLSCFISTVCRFLFLLFFIQHFSVLEAVFHSLCCECIYACTRHIHSNRPKQIWIISLFHTQSYYFWMPNYYM